MAGAARGMNEIVRSPQSRMKYIAYHVTQSAGAYTISGEEGSESLTLTKNGTGDVTLTLKTQAGRKIIPAGMPAPDVANLQASVVSRTAAAIRFAFTNNSGTATETGFAGVLAISDDIVLRG